MPFPIYFPLGRGVVKFGLPFEAVIIGCERAIFSRAVRFRRSGCGRAILRTPHGVGGFSSREVGWREDTAKGKFKQHFSGREKQVGDSAATRFSREANPCPNGGGL